MVRRHALDEGDAARQAPLFGVLPAAREIQATDVNTDSVCSGRGFQHPQQKLTPAATVVNDAHRPAGGQVRGEAVSALSRKRPVKRQSSARAEASGISHEPSPY